jgi:hypothetical protein
MYGRKVMGIERTTFVIGPDGKIEKIYGKVKAKGPRRGGAGGVVTVAQAFRPVAHGG